MRIALLSDVHANLPALEAVLRGIREKSPDKILSLGDQINLGPLPAETLALLRSEGVVCLSGNHERYVLSVLRGDSAYDGANFESLRFQAQYLRMVHIPRADDVDEQTKRELAEAFATGSRDLANEASRRAYGLEDAYA